MIDNKFKQIIIPNSKYCIEDLEKNVIAQIFNDENKNIYPYKMIISVPSEAWLYIDDDIAPVVIDADHKFNYSLEDSKTFKSLYCVLNQSKYEWNGSQWVISDKGNTIEKNWQELTGYSIIDISDYFEYSVFAIFCANLINRINNVDSTDIKQKLSKYLGKLNTAFQNNINSNEPQNAQVWINQFMRLIEIILGLSAEEFNNLFNTKIILTFFYRD